MPCAKGGDDGSLSGRHAAGKGFLSYICSMDNDVYVKEAVELLSRLIAVPRVSRNEKDAADMLEDFMRRCGMPVRRYANNIVSTCGDYDGSRPTVLLNAHIDTVRPAASWTRDPYMPCIDGGRLYGIGSNDCGGGLVSLLQAYRIVASRPRSFNVIYAATAEEEVSGANGFSLVLPQLPPIAVAIVGEPTGLQPAVAEKGLMVIDATARGKAGHAARNEGINAIYVALDDINWLRSYRFPRVSELLGPVKMTVTVINAGTQHNVVPDECRFVIDVRTNELYANSDVFDIIQRNVRSEVKARSFRLNSSHIEMSHPLVRKMLARGLKPYGSPTLSDQALMPFPSVKLGPGASSRSHSADEFIAISEIADAISLYVKLLSGGDCL